MAQHRATIDWQLGERPVAAGPGTDARVGAPAGALDERA